MSTICDNAKTTPSDQMKSNLSENVRSSPSESMRSTQQCDNMKSMKKYTKIWSNGCVDYDMMSKLVTDDIVMNEPSGGEIRGKKDFIEHFKQYNQSFSPLYVRIRHSTLEQDGSILCLWSYWGKFTKEYMGVKPNNQWCHMEGSSRYCFNNNGHLFRAQSFYDGTSFEEMIKKATSSRERLCSDYFKFLNGEISATVMRNNYHKCATFSDAKKKNCEIDKMIPLMERFSVFAPNSKYEFECAPSCDDFDLWIGCYTLKAKIEHENQMGLSVGKCFEIPGMVSFRFNQNDQIVQQNDTFNINDFYKK